MRTDLHLVFPGNCRDAFAFYEKTFNSKIFMTMTYGDAPPGSPVPPDSKDRVMHTAMPLGSITLMGCDTPAGVKSPIGGFHISISLSDEAEVKRLSLRKETLYRDVVREIGLEPLPGARTWLQRLAAVGIPCVIGSSTHRENIEVSLDVLGFRGFFSKIVTAEDVTHGKPDPEVFLKAAEKIGTAPERCVVFEDAHVGIEAAHSAGMRVIGVATTNPLDELGEADAAVSRLDELQVGKIAEWFGWSPCTA